MAQKIDVHQQITDRIIAAIEQGAGEFKLPWHRPAGSITRPTNIQSKKGYRGINVVTLWVEAQMKGYSVPVWGTYKQFSEAGLQVRKGEKASLVVFYKEIEFERASVEVKDGDDSSASAWMARGY
jgi:antirestriction protein ArdC